MHINLGMRAAVLIAGFIASMGIAVAAEPPIPPRKPPVPSVLARPVAEAVPTTYPKGAPILDVDGLKIINTGKVDALGQVLLVVTSCNWGGKPYGSAVLCKSEPDPEHWIVGHLHIIQVYTGRTFNVIVNEVKEDGSVISSFTTSGPGNRKIPQTKRGKPTKTAHAR